MASDELLTVDEVAARLKVRPSTVQGWIRRRELAAISLGGRSGYRVRESALTAFLAAREGKAAA